jgi:hypothetical protein
METPGSFTLGLRGCDNVSATMDLHIEIELRAPLLRVTAKGNFKLDPAVRLLKHACDMAAEKQIRKIIVNALAMDGELSTMERPLGQV